MHYVPYFTVTASLLMIIRIFLWQVVLSGMPDRLPEFLFDVISTIKTESSNLLKPWIINAFIPAIANCGEAAGDPGRSSPATSPEGTRRG
jgi:hypothetical protein